MRLVAADGSTWHYEGAARAERLVCKVRADGTHEYYEGERGREELLCTVAPAAAPLPRLSVKRRREEAVGADDENACIVCFSARRTHVATECGHNDVCEACSYRLPTCPVCRAETEWVRVLRS